MYTPEDLRILDNLPADVRLTFVTMRYRAVAGKPQGGFDPAIHASELLARGNLIGFQAELLQIELLTKNLRDIGAVYPGITALLRNRLSTKTGSLSNYIGWRMEARIASSLSRKGVRFEYDDAPDFTIAHEGESVAIECTSTHVEPSTPVDKDLGYKITSAVRKKGRMGYADGSLAIAVDISGITKIRQGKSLDRDQHGALLKAACQDSLAGSAVLFHTIFLPQTNRVEFVYSRHDAEKISPALKSFLDKQYPIEGRLVLGPFYA